MTQEPDKPVSIIRIILDAIFINLIVWIIVYIWSVYKTKSPLASVLLSFLIIILLDIAIFIKNYNAYITNRNKRRRECVVNHFSHRISQLNEEEFQLQLIKILLNCKGFSDIYYDKEIGLLKADYNSTPVSIGFHHPAPGEKTPFSKVWEFIQRSKNAGFDQGFFFTSSSFEKDCNKERIGNPGFSVQLMDFSYILNRMEEAGMFPDESTIDQLIAGEIRKQKINRQKVKDKIFTISKSRQYLSVSILFLIVGLLFKGSSLYFLAVSMLFSSLALFTRLLIPESPNNIEKSQLSTDDSSYKLR